MKVTLVWLDEAESSLATAFMEAKRHGRANEFTLAIHRGEQAIRTALIPPGNPAADVSGS